MPQKINIKFIKMKNIITNCFLLATLLMVGCKKNDNRYPFDVELARVPYLTVKTDISTRLSANCAYDPAIYAGDFVVVKDDFSDFAPGQTVRLTRISNSSFSFIDPYATSPLPIIVNVNTENNITSITKQKIGNAFVWGLSYINPTVAATSLTNNFVAPCDKTVTLNISYSIDQGGFGSYVLVLKKK
ncbi:MAG: hypothetical protein WKF59_10970 [Chitinophagaceae bacterium]